VITYRVELRSHGIWLEDSVWITRFMAKRRLDALEAMGYRYDIRIVEWRQVLHDALSGVEREMAMT